MAHFDPISMPNLDDPKKQEKLKYGSFDLKDNPKAYQKYDLLKERLCIVKRMDICCSMDAIELCLVPDVVIYLKFKILNFEKYDAAKYLATHITMYCRKMATYAHDDKLLIHFF